MNLDDLALVEEVAPLLGMAPATLRKRCARCEFPHHKLPNSRRVLLSKAHIDAYLAGAELEVKRLAGGGRLVTPKRIGGRTMQKPRSDGTN